MEEKPLSRLTDFRRLQRSTEWLFKFLAFDAKKGYPITKLVINLIMDFGDWGQMCIDVLTALMEFWGYIIP